MALALRQVDENELFIVDIDGHVTVAGLGIVEPTRFAGGGTFHIGIMIASGGVIPTHQHRIRAKGFDFVFREGLGRAEIKIREVGSDFEGIDQLVLQRRLCHSCLLWMNS
ncbi:hypothetical protein DESC_350037 [Desulfosarcina cetonica]|nr:hypothetical protein DESC_350037 [Desulfosarcina cetonica]